MILLKINEIERKLENLVLAMNDLKKERSDLNDTENLISEEAHWCVKIFRKFFCYILKKRFIETDVSLWYELHLTEDMETQVDMEEEEEEEDSSDDDSFNCADSEVMDIVQSVLTRIFEDNRDRVSKKKFNLILQMILKEPEFLNDDDLLSDDN